MLSRSVETALCGAVVAAIAVVVYFRTLHPSVGGGDSGELMVVAHELGTPHPPGYPTFAMTTKAAEVGLRAIFPTLSIAMAQNAFHTFLSCLSLVALFGATTVLSGAGTEDGVDPAAGVLGALLFGFAPNVWTYAVSTEVFPLNNLLMCVWVLLAALHGAHLQRNARADGAASRVDTSSNRFLLYLSSFVAGLSLTNQHTSVLFVAPVVLWVFATDREVLRVPHVFLKSTALFFLGLSPYLYLPLSSRFVVSSNSWGECDSWDGFWTHFLRKEYGTFSLASKEADWRVANFSRAWRYYIGDISDQTMGWAWALAPIGVLFALRDSVVALFRRHSVDETNARERPQKQNAPIKNNNNASPACNTDTAAKKPASGAGTLVFDSRTVLFLVWALYCNFFNYLANLPIDQPLFYGVQQRFWLQPLILVCAFIGVGFSIVTRKTLRWPLVARLAVALAVGIAQISAHFATQDESANFYVRDFGHAILRPLPHGSFLLTKGDVMINSARFVQVTEGFRPDITILDQELLTFEWYNKIVKRQFPNVSFPGDYYYPGRPNTYDMRRWLERNRDPVKRRVFLAVGYKEGDGSVQGYYTSRQFGIIEEVITVKEAEVLKRPKGLASTASAATKRQQAAYVSELAASVPPIDSGAHRLPVAGGANRYPSTSWEAVVLGDVGKALSAIAYQLMSLGELDDTVSTRQPRSYEDNMKDSYHFRALTASVGVFQTALRAPFDRPDSALVHPVPAYVGRNYGVALVSLLKYDPRNATLAASAHEAFASHLTVLRAVIADRKERQKRSESKPIDSDAAGTTLEDVKNMEEAVKYYKHLAESLRSGA